MKSITTDVIEIPDVTGGEYHEPTEAEIFARLEKFLESVRRSMRAVDATDTPLSKSVAKHAQIALQRLASLAPVEDRIKAGLTNYLAEQIAKRTGTDRKKPLSSDSCSELIELTRSLVRKIAKRLGLVHSKLLAGDPGEWELAMDAEIGGRHGTLTACMAAFADSIRMPQRIEDIAVPSGPAATAETVHPDGPCAPNQLWFKNEWVDLPPVPFRLIQYMWSKECVQLRHVTNAAWPMDAPSDTSLQNAKRKVNAALLKLGCPKSLQVKADFLILK